MRGRYGKPKLGRELDHGGPGQLCRKAGGRVQLVDAPSERPDDAPATGVGAKGDRGGGQQNDPNRNLEALEMTCGQQRQGDDGHRFLRIVGSMGIGNERRRENLKIAKGAIQGNGARAMEQHQQDRHDDRGQNEPGRR